MRHHFILLVTAAITGQGIDVLGFQQRSYILIIKIIIAISSLLMRLTIHSRT